MEPEPEQKLVALQIVIVAYSDRT